MRSWRHLGRVGLTLLLIPVFLVTVLLSAIAPADAAKATSPPSPQQSAPSPSTSVSETPALDVPEDPLSGQSEQQTPEISVQVDVRDGHLITRVVDIWGPGRTPQIWRSYTNARQDPTYTPDTDVPPYTWQFNPLLDIVTTGTSDQSVLEPNGNRSVYKFSSSRTIGPQPDYTERWDVYVKSIGTYSTLEMHYNNCVWHEPGGNQCTWDGTHLNYLPKGAIRRYQDGKIVEERDANGNVTTFAYTTFADGVGKYLSTVTDAVGRQMPYAWEHAYQKCVRRNSDGCQLMAWVYRVRTVTDPYGRGATYTYDASSRLTAVTNAAGFITRYGYDIGGRLNSVTDALSFATAITWAGVYPARVSQVTGPDGKSTSYAYTGDPVIKTVVTDARAKQTIYEMNVTTDNSDLVKVTDPLLNIAQYAYDSRHNVTQVTDARGNITTFAYNTHNKPTQVVRASGSLNLTTNLSWDSPDTTPLKENLLSVTNPRGISTSYAYDGNSNLTSVRRAVGTADEALTQYTYTTWGGVASVIDPRGNTTIYAYTTRHQIQTVTPPVGGPTSFTYSMVDDQVTMTDGNGNGHTWTTAYGAMRLVTSVADPLNNTVRHEYDANGKRTKTYDGKNQQTSFTYDNRNRLTTITDPLNGTTGYQYDAVGNLVKITSARTPFLTSFAYDDANRLLQVTDALGQQTAYTYDQVGNRASMTDRKRVMSTYTYDSANRLTQVSAGGIVVAYTYDADSNRLTMTDSTGTTNYAYDSLDRLTSTRYPDVKSVQFSYDKAGNRTSLTYPGGTASLTYAYDAANRLSQIMQGTLQWTFTYDSAGNRTRLTQPNGTQTVYTYLTNNWLSSVAHQNAGGSPFETISSTYDANGNRASQTDSSGSSTYTYDVLNRLIQAVYPGTYGTWSWTYDAVGNRTQQVAPAGTTIYTYDGNNRLTQAGGVVYTYDANGNLIGTSAGQSFTYDPFNRMTQAVGTGGTATYTYNGDGLKVQRIGPDGTTRYYHDGFRPIWETDGAGVMTAQLDRDVFGNLLSRVEPGSRRYYHTDGIGSTVALTDETGAAAASMLYDAWGNVRTSGGTGHGKYRFTGAELDAASGLYHMGARFYDPSIGRWLGEDPVRNLEPASLNFYAYVANNPLVLIDPTGMTQDQGSGGCDLGCLNEHRQQAARASWEGNGQVVDEVTVAEYRAYLEVSRIFGHEAAMSALEVAIALGSKICACGSVAASPRDLWQLIKALYYTSATFLSVKAFTMTVSFIIAMRSGQGMSWLNDAYKNPITEIGVWTFIGAYIMDAKYFNGAVLGETLPEMEHMIVCTASLSCR